MLHSLFEARARNGIGVSERSRSDSMVQYGANLTVQYQKEAKGAVPFGAITIIVQ